jgi:hypothetical protein
MTLLAGPIFDGTAKFNNIAALGEGTHEAECGFVYLDEESKMSLPIGATVKAEQ